MSKALSELVACESADVFKDTWYTFLVAAKNVYTALEQGSKSDPKDRQWFGGVKSIRRSDPLLQYLFQARDDDEHGIEAVTEFVPGSVGIGVAKEGYSNHIHIESIENGVVKGMRSLDAKPILIEETLPHMKLLTVTARGNVKYNPPIMHLGKSITDTSPAGIAQLAFAYLQSVVEVAKSR